MLLDYTVWCLQQCREETQQAHRGGGAGDTSPGPPNLFREKGPHEAFKSFFAFLGCIITLFLLLSLSIALSGPND